jgi:hypothetical protein
MKDTSSTTSAAAISALVLLFALGFAFTAPSLSAHEIKAGALTIVHPWARATPPGAKVAGGYLTVENAGAEPDRLVAATVEIAGRAEIHEMAVVDGIMKMRPLRNGVEIPAGGSVALEPGSYHMMFMDLTRPLKEGESFAGTLTFEKAGSVEVTFAVGPLGASEMPEHEDHMGQ